MKLKVVGCEKVNGYLRSRVQINFLKLLQIPIHYTSQPHGTLGKKIGPLTLAVF